MTYIIVKCKMKKNKTILSFFIVRRRGRDRMVVGFTTTYAIGVYHHWCCGIDPAQGEVHTLCDEVCQWLAAGRWFSPGPLVSSTNKTEILLKVALNTMKTKTKPYCSWYFFMTKYSHFALKLVVPFITITRQPE